MLNSGMKGCGEVASASNFTLAGVATSVRPDNFVYEEANDTFIRRRGDAQGGCWSSNPTASAHRGHPNWK